MPENFTKLNIGSPKDLDFVFATLASHGRGISQDKLAERRERSGEVARRIEGGLDQWFKSTRGRLQQNLQVNGIDYNDFVKQKQDMEPFDEALSKRVQTLTETTEKLTEEAIINRKTVPSQRAAAIRRREALWADLELARLESRQQAAASKENVRSAAPLNLPDVPRRSDQKRALDAALTEVASLQISLLQQSAAANNTSSLVKRLRTA